jgi:1,4-alpha-glucan branching enzyme
MMKKLLSTMYGMLVVLALSAQTYNITFQVDMNDVGASFTNANVNGNFNGWCGNCAPMSDANMDGVWEITIPLDAGTYEYKFTYDGWTGQESLIPGSPCTITSGSFTNRTLTVEADAVLPVVCYGSCTECGVVVVNTLDLPVTFDDPEVEYGVIGFGGADVSTIEPDPTDANNTVAKVIKSATAESWAGTTIMNSTGQGLANPIPFTASNTQMTLRVWSPDAGIQVRLKAEDYLDPTHSCETEATTTVAGEWETLTFDFANEAPGTAALNLSYYLNKVSVFFNFGVTGAVAGEKTYYFDDLYFGEVVQPVSYNVTFQVDMSEVTESFTTPEVNGSFNGWCGACAPMSDANGDGIWELTIALEEGNYEFKYAYDNWANGGETLAPGGSCTVTNGDFTNRALAVTGDLVLPVVCYGSCSPCNVMPAMYDVTFQVDMNNVTETFTTPEVNGSFNGWCGACAPMSDANGDGIWELTISLEEGNYEFKYAYDNWANGGETLAPGGSCTVTNGDFTNRALAVTGDMVMPVVCYGSCSPCNVMPTMYDITFQVDMNNVTETFTTPEVNGSFNGWCGACAPMTDDNGDNIWELTIALEAGTYEFKYAYDNWANGGESLTAGSACTVTNGDFTNRSLVVTEDAVLPVVCYSSCFACNAAGFYNVLFQVDMSEVTEPFTTPEVNGTFNGWCGACAPMSDDNGDGIWELVIPLEAGNYEYKFAYDNWTGQETLAPGSSCTITTGAFTNRTLTVTGETTLPVVCWGSCTDCDNPTGPFNVTFAVDMSEVSFTYTTPELNGTFNNWCGNCAQMTDANGDDIWEITISLAADTFDYKFSYDNWAGQESLTAGSSCTATVDNFTNRRIIVTGETTLEAVCWESCAPCIVNVEEVNQNNLLSVYPNPAQDVLNIEFTDAIQDNAVIRILDAGGRVVLEQKSWIAQRFVIDTSLLSDGMYYTHITTEKLNFNKPFVVKK